MGTTSDVHPSQTYHFGFLIGINLYTDLVNKAYKLSGKQALSASGPKSVGTRVITRIEEHFRLLPQSVAEFSHYDPAVFLVENGNQFVDVPGLNEALDLFERVFQDFNALLPKVESVAA